MAAMPSMGATAGRASATARPSNFPTRPRFSPGLAYGMITDISKGRGVSEEAARQARLRNRFAEINVWRPIRGPIESAPLAVCDAQSIDPMDFVPTDFVYRDKIGEVYRFTYNPRHRWSYFPRLERGEVILLKCYDSKEDGRARFSAHTAFDDPTSAPDGAPRESIEVRALIFWPTEQ
jgi:hypothetical protein